MPEKERDGLLRAIDADETAACNRTCTLPHNATLNDGQETSTACTEQPRPARFSRMFQEVFFSVHFLHGILKNSSIKNYKPRIKSAPR